MALRDRPRQLGHGTAATELGLSLEGPLSALRVWAETHMPEIDRSNRLADESSADQPRIASPGRAP
ncbi:hypothetical protein JHN59_01110 [Streptomyces sp. MBT49]|nr:hypothetical protein [Streptomyces sp. MBT49]MBK3623465.1 hypothetical protein [Streptomyces sp. MBT49]